MDTDAFCSEEHVVRSLKDMLVEDLPAMLADFSLLTPEVGGPLEEPAEWLHGEVIDVTDYPTLNIWSSSISPREYRLSFSPDGHTAEHFVDVLIDLYLVWDEPEALYFRLLRYKTAIIQCLKDSPSLGGKVMGCFVQSTQNSNLYSDGRNLSQACRISVRVLTTDH